jgi:glycerophosphoryl diester phosphodiesterase
MKAAAVECDVRMTRDNQVVVIHDSNTLRTSGVDISIEDANYSELSQLDVGSFKDLKYAGEKIPLLADIIQTIPAGKNKRLFIEVKCGTEVLPYLKRIIEDSGKREQIVLISFKIEVVAQAKKILPDIPAYWLVMTNKDEKTGRWIPHSLELIDKTKGYGLDGLNLNWAGLNKDFVRKAHKASLGVYAWTVDDPNSARKLEKMSIDGITSNKPDLLMKEL